MICGGLPAKVQVSVFRTLASFHFTLVSKFFTREFSVNVEDCCTSKWCKGSYLVVTCIWHFDTFCLLQVTATSPWFARCPKDVPRPVRYSYSSAPSVASGTVTACSIRSMMIFIPVDQCWPAHFLGVMNETINQSAWTFCMFAMMSILKSGLYMFILLRSVQRRFWQVLTVQFQYSNMKYTCHRLAQSSQVT